MRRGFEQSAERMGAPLAALLALGLIGQAEAAGLPSAPDAAVASAVSQCGEPEGGCGRIRGHIPAASDPSGVGMIAGDPGRGGAPLAPFLSDLGAAGRAAIGSLNRNLLLLPVSQDPSVR